MYVVTIIPLSRNMPMATLPYLSKTDMMPGTFVTVPFRKQEIMGLVLDCASAADMKSEIRAMPFSLRSGVNSADEYMLPIRFINEMMEQIKHSQCNPHDYLEVLYNPDHEWIQDMQWQDTRRGLHAVQSSTTERISEYERLVEQSSRPVVVIVPSTSYAKEYTGMISGSIAITTDAQLAKFQKNKHPTSQIVFTTLHYLGRLLNSVSTVVFDNYTNLLYHLYVRENLYIDRAAVWINVLLYSVNHQVIVADRVVRFGDYRHIVSVDRFNYALPAPTIIALPQPVQRSKKSKTPFEEQQLELVMTWIRNRQPERMVIICNQKEWFGYASCSQCGYLHRCSTCERPMRVQRHSRAVITFHCSSCGIDRPIDDICPGCGGYTMETRRYGIEKYSEMIHQGLPQYNIHILTADTKNVRSVTASWIDYSGVLIATSKYFFAPMPDPDMVYITPAYWSHVEGNAPEAPLREYLQLADTGAFVLMSRQSWNRVCHECEGLPTDWRDQALSEVRAAEKHGMILPCTIW